MRLYFLNPDGKRKMQPPDQFERTCRLRPSLLPIANFEVAMRPVLLLLFGMLTMCEKKTDIVAEKKSTGWHQVYQYDEQGRIREFVDEKGAKTLFHYNDDGSVTKTLPDGSSVTTRGGKEVFATGPQEKK